MQNEGPSPTLLQSPLWLSSLSTLFGLNGPIRHSLSFQGPVSSMSKEQGISHHADVIQVIEM